MTKRGEKVDSFDVTVKIFAWLEVFFATLIAGLIVAIPIYLSKPNSIRLKIALAILVLSFVIGCVLANKNRKEKQQIHREATTGHNSSAEDGKEGQAVSKQRTT